MNPGVFPGVGQGVIVGSISRYIQTPTITTSQTINVPPGTQRIEALLCGGGGGGSSGSGAGGFGGLAVMEIPVTGYPLQIVIGAGGTGNSTAGSPTYVVSAGTRYAEVGGGGLGQSATSSGGRSGGGGGGGRIDILPFLVGFGGNPPIGKLLWTLYTQTPTYKLYQFDSATTTYFPNPVSGAGLPYCNGSLGGGGGGNGGEGGGGGFNGAVGTAGSLGGGGCGSSGGSLATISIWGYTGFAGGAAGSGGNGGGGGGMLAAGSSGTAGSCGAGGLGGGGGGGSVLASAGANGGNGFAAIRFYL